MEHLAIIVEGMVAVELLQMRADGGPTEHDIAWCRERADDLLEHGDIFMGASTSKEHKQRGRSLATLARTIAVMAWIPGGVTIFGRHWEEQHDGAWQRK